MVVFDGRKICFLAFCFFIIFAFCFINNREEIKNAQTIQTSSTPVSLHTVILDAGHGQPDRTEL